MHLPMLFYNVDILFLFFNCVPIFSKCKSEIFVKVHHAIRVKLSTLAQVSDVAQGPVLRKSVVYILCISLPYI